MNKKTDVYTLKKAFETSLPTLAGYGLMGMAFGLLMADAGFNFIWAGIMGLIIYGGTMQFVAVELLANHASLLDTAIITLLIHSRHIFYSISMIDKYKDRGKARPYLFYALTDETYALVNLPPDPQVNKAQFDLDLSIMNQCYWILGDMTGALLGSFSLFNTEGVDFAMTALFIVIFLEQLLTSDEFSPAVIGVGSALLCLIVFGPENFLLPAMLLILAGLLFVRKKLEKPPEEKNRD